MCLSFRCKYVNIQLMLILKGINLQYGLVKMKKGLLTTVQTLPLVFSFLLLAAHFLRYGILPLVIIILLFPIILIFRKPVAARIIQIALVLGTAEWIRTTVSTIIFREHIQQPWGRYLIIMASVTLFTFISAFVFFSKNLKTRYKLNNRELG